MRAWISCLSERPALLQLYIEPLTLLEAARALRKRNLSAVELTNHALERIARLNPDLNAFITITADSARARALALDQELAGGIDRGPLHGIPIAHKDCFSTKGVRTTGGSKILANRMPDHDAAIVEQMDRAGAVMLGKTNLHELCYGITSNNPHFGAVHNPWDMERIPGGSSGGSAAAVSADLVFAASGTDTGGSIRVPAAFCGVVGLKPTYGRLSRRGVMPLGLTLDHVGPIARTVRDTEACFRAMAGEAPVPETRSDVTGLRIGVPANFFFDRLEPEITSSIRHAVQTLAGLDARMLEVHIREMDALNSIGRLVLFAEASSIWKRHLVDRPADFGDDVRAALERGCEVPATEYLDAQRRRRILSKRLATLWAGIDCLLCPATPTTAPRIGDAVIRIGGIEEDVRIGSTRLVRPFNVLGWPALAMPCGFSDAGLPIGLQLIAAPGQEAIIFRAGAALEDSLGLAHTTPTSHKLESR
jgi:aspartyl-tRNA(Asn)/glutamyl-tRNA(Gln) amidotransferase subunit A